jgi:hypothetical protein
MYFITGMPVLEMWCPSSSSSPSAAREPAIPASRTHCSTKTIPACSMVMLRAASNNSCQKSLRTNFGLAGEVSAGGAYHHDHSNDVVPERTWRPNRFADAWKRSFEMSRTRWRESHSGRFRQHSGFDLKRSPSEIGSKVFALTRHRGVSRNETRRALISLRRRFPVLEDELSP